MASTTQITPAKGSQNIAYSLPIALLRAREKVMGPIRHMLVDTGVTEQQWRVMRVLQERGPCDASEIAQSACLLMPSLTRILQILTEKGFCTREIHPKDKRRLVVKITRSGHEFLKANQIETNRIFAQIEKEFGTDNLNHLLKMLGNFAEPAS